MFRMKYRLLRETARSMVCVSAAWCDNVSVGGWGDSEGVSVGGWGDSEGVSVGGWGDSEGECEWVGR